jgi:hypothetical protein
MTFELCAAGDVSTWLQQVDQSSVNFAEFGFTRLWRSDVRLGSAVNAGAKTDHVAAQNQASGGAAKRHGARAPQIAGACHGALARRANPVTDDQVAAPVLRARL